MSRKIISVLLAAVICLSVFSVSVFAEGAEEYTGNLVRNVTTGEEYATINKAAKAIKDGETIQLLYNISLSTYVTIRGERITIDLNGYEISAPGQVLDLYGYATIRDTAGGGRISGSEKKAVWVNSNSTVTSYVDINGGITVDGYNDGTNAKLYLQGGTISGIVQVQGIAYANVKNTTITASDRALSVTDGGAAVIENSNITGEIYVRDNNTSLTINSGTFTANYNCIAGDAGENLGGTSVTINDGTFRTVSKTGVAVFQPQAGTLTINGGTFQGGDALYLKGGNTTINGGTFRAVGALAGFNHDDSKYRQTGDAVVIESCGGNGGQPTLAIYNGTFYSRNGGSLGVYQYGNNPFASTAFVYRGLFEKEVPAQYWVNPDVFTLINFAGGFATYNPSTNKVTLQADEDSVKVEVYKYSTTGEVIAFSDPQGGVVVTESGQMYARSGGQVNMTIGSKTYVLKVSFGEFDVTELLSINNSRYPVVSGMDVTLVPVDDTQPITVAARTLAGTLIAVNSITGGARVSKSGTLYSKTDGTASVTVLNSGTFNVIFDFPEEEFILADNLKVTNATVTVNETTITLDPVSESTAISMVARLLDGSELSFSNLSENAMISKSGSLYSTKYATAKTTIRGTVYTIVLNFPQQVVELKDNLRVTNATIAVSNNTITLTPVNESSSVSLVPRLFDGTAISFSNLSADARLSKSGSLYSSKYSTATVDINGTAYTVVLNFPQQEIPLSETLKVSNATVAVSGTTITLTPIDSSKSASMAARLLDGTAISFSNLSADARLSKSGSLYAYANASATANIKGTNYTVVFVFSPVETPLIDLLKYNGATAAVSDTTITFTATAAQVNFYPTLFDSTAITFSNVSGVAAVSKSGTLYAKGNAAANVTIDGVVYNVVFLF